MPKAQENAGDELVIAFSLASDWSREWSKFSTPITERRKAKSQQSRITFDIIWTIVLKRTFSIPVDKRNLIYDDNFPGPVEKSTVKNNRINSTFIS